MLYPIYKSIKARLQLQVTSLKDIQWFNNQYAGVIHAEPLALVEFRDELNIAEISKITTRANCAINIHVLSKAIGDSDGTITDNQVETHEALVAQVSTALRHWSPTSELGAALGSAFIYTTHKIDHSYNGWLVTVITFTTKIIA